MAVSTLPFPQTEYEFNNMFPDEDACIHYMTLLKWSRGFTCLKCGTNKGYWSKRKGFECGRCHQYEYLTGGTALHRSKIPLLAWFWAAFLISTTDISAYQFWKCRSDTKGLRSYESVFNMFHILRRGLSYVNLDALHGVIEVGSTFIQEKNRMKKGKSVLVAGAVKSSNANGSIEYVKLQILSDQTGKTLSRFVFDSAASGSTLCMDTHSGHQYLNDHYDIRVGSSVTKHVYKVIDDFKSWMINTYWGVSPKYMQSYANEFAFRASIKPNPVLTFQRMLGLPSAA